MWRLLATILYDVKRYPSHVVICFAVAEPSSGYRFHVSTTLSLLLWSYLILSDTHVFSVESKHNRLATSDVCFGLPSSWLRWHAQGTALPQNLKVRDLLFSRHGRAKKLMSWFSSVHNPSITNNLQTSIEMWYIIFACEMIMKKQWIGKIQKRYSISIISIQILHPIPFYYHHLKHIMSQVVGNKISFHQCPTALEGQ